MPIFEFSCSDCGSRFEEIMSREQLAAGRVACPDCGSSQVQRSLSAFATSSSGSAGAPPCGGGGCGGAFT